MAHSVSCLISRALKKKLGGPSIASERLRAEAPCNEAGCGLTPCFTDRVNAL